MKGETMLLTSISEKGKTLKLDPGNVIAIYTDEGPSGICAQSMSVTSPHAMLLWFEDIDKFDEWNKRKVSVGKRSALRYAVIGDYSSYGTISVKWCS